ncbi:hypothetical protein CVT24_004445 [Panaeolus cyanescens]|uniref:Secreted protein n=1 Tax=Panaeolus cyanescens TaxID=181874 RepID=A0A409YBL6_9AGAR|nr:hypothetical protein CVT24_004445 [Panaeolus cyanescens]
MHRLYVTVLASLTLIYDAYAAPITKSSANEGNVSSYLSLYGRGYGDPPLTHTHTEKSRSKGGKRTRITTSVQYGGQPLVDDYFVPAGPLHRAATFGGFSHNTHDYFSQQSAQQSSSRPPSGIRHVVGAPPVSGYQYTSRPPEEASQRRPQRSATMRPTSGGSYKDRQRDSDRYPEHDDIPRYSSSSRQKSADDRDRRRTSKTTSGSTSQGFEPLGPPIYEEPESPTGKVDAPTHSVYDQWDRLPEAPKPPPAAW